MPDPATVSSCHCPAGWNVVGTVWEETATLRPERDPGVGDAEEGADGADGGGGGGRYRLGWGRQHRWEVGPRRWVGRVMVTGEEGVGVTGEGVLTGR